MIRPRRAPSWTCVVGLVVVLAPTFGGCVALLPPIEHEGNRCEFAGSTPCAKCIEQSCRASVDACCDSSACAGEDGHAPILDALDACGRGEASACASGLGSGTSAAAASLRTCVRASCTEICLGDAPVKVEWSCGAAPTRDNACSACIFERCQSTLGECCSDSSCSKSESVIEGMQACISADAPGCTYITTTESSSGYEGKLRACIANECGASCFGSGRAHQKCELYAGGTYCSCADAKESSGPDCSASQIGTSEGAKCVLGKRGCTCGRYSCVASSGRCQCDYVRTGSDTSCSAPILGSGTRDRGKCCVSFGDRGPTCTCDSYYAGCGSNEFSIESCDEETLTARLSPEVFVTKCSL